MQVLDSAVLKPAATGTSLYLEATAHVAGGNDTNWRTDVGLHASGHEDAVIRKKGAEKRCRKRRQKGASHAITLLAAMEKGAEKGASHAITLLAAMVIALATA